MRCLTMFGMLTLATALWIPATCAALQIPGGSYQQTCRDIGVRGSTLYATCQNMSRGWQATELRNFYSCNQEIQNIDGNLRCGGTRGNRGHDSGWDRDRGYGNAPNGSYVQTCQNITMDGYTLQASCQKRNGTWRQTSLRNYNQCSDIANNNGKLRCVR
jgi:CVNH domain-containing protein